MLLYRRSFKYHGRAFHLGVHGNLRDRDEALFEAGADARQEELDGSVRAWLTLLRASASFILTWDRRKR